jgi:hypothetical protein
MKKIVVFFFLFGICLNANILHDKIENLLGNKSYETHQKLIDHLFKDETKFVQDEKLNYIEILSTLKQNGLLDLRYEKPQEVFIQMVMSDNPMKSLKIFNDTLKSLGYYYYFTKQINKNDGLIDEVIFLEKTYTREPSCMNSIGISETLDYLDSKITKEQLHEKISQNTARLAKSQRTFNKGQFKEIFSDELDQIRQKILTDF